MRKKTGRILAACLGALLLFVCWLIWSPVRGVPVLEYHMTGDDALPDELPYIVPQADLAAQLDYLQAAGYTTITMRDYLAARQGEYTLPAKPVILTGSQLPVGQMRTDGKENLVTSIEIIVGTAIRAMTRPTGPVVRKV